MMWPHIMLSVLVGATEERARKLWRALAALAVVVTLVGLAATGWLIVQDGVYGWQTVDWERLDAAIFLPWPFLFTLVFVVITLVARRRTPLALTAQFRELVASGDMRVSYPAVFQPAPLLPQEVATGAHTFQRLAAAEGWLQRRFTPMGFVVAIQYVTLSSNLDRALGTRNFFSISVTSLWFFVVTLLLPMCVLIVYLVVFIVQLVRRPRLSITVDEQGVMWQGGKRGRKHQIGWNAVRSFSIMVYQDGMSSRTSFVVDGGDATLAWTLSPSSGFDEYGESWQLSREIVTRSGQMLRDLAPLTASLVMTRANPSRLRAIGAPEALLAGVMATKRHLYRTAFTAALLGVGLIALLFVGIFGMGYSHYYQQHYFAGLASKIHAGKQLYHDALTTSDGEWPTMSQGAGSDQTRLGVVDGAYQMSAPKGNFAEWTISPDFGDMAVEATVQLGAPETEYSGAGLVVRSNRSDNDLLVFFVNPFSGDWSLTHYAYNFVNPDKSWHTLASGTSSAVRIGADVGNTLLALARGDVILLYINGHLVNAYSAQDHFNENNYEAPLFFHSGSVGVYNNDGENVARFTDFTVYAVTSAPSLEYA